MKEALLLTPRPLTRVLCLKGTWMNRRNWSNLFVILAAMSLMLGFWPENRVKVVSWLVAPACLFLGAVARRRMV
jgi:hypothetical protein